MLIKRKTGETTRTSLQSMAGVFASEALDRRSFLKRSGLTATGLAAIGTLGSVKKAEAVIPYPKARIAC